MIKGCERRMIKIENTESDLFESAYFIIRQNAQLPKKNRRDDMLREAARIVSEKTEASGRRAEGRKKWLERTAVFIAGVLLSAAVALVVWLM